MQGKDCSSCAHVTDSTSYKTGVKVDGGCPKAVRIHGVRVVARTKREGCTDYVPRTDGKSA